MKPLGRAIIVAPLIPALLWAAPMRNPVVLPFAVSITCFGLFAFGLPLYFLARRHRHISAFTCMTSGGLSGAFSGLVLSWYFNSAEMSLWFARSIILFVAFGVVAGFSFWRLGCVHSPVSA
ncbi:MAG: hypothetical protein LBB76_04340 [Azoarcus sp.]|jgi:hypothetical protein|nr:hypothetical protein [Azoarcus sp.]